MIGLTLKHLRYFDALAREGHFGRAAARCSITQPALSQQIKELEMLLDAPLVERGARQIRLTTLGEVFAERARNILHSVDEIQDIVRSKRGPLTGAFRLGVIPTIAPYLLPQIIGALSNSFPNMQVVPREAVTQSVVAKLLDNHLDAAIVALPTSEPELREFALFEEEFLLVRHESEAMQPVPKAGQLETMRLLLLEEGHCFRDQALSFCTAGELAPANLMEGSSLSTLVQMVGARMGVTLIPEIAMHLEGRIAPVSTVRFPQPAPKRTVGMVWRKSNPLAEQMMEIASAIRIVGTNFRDDSRGAE